MLINAATNTATELKGKFAFAEVDAINGVILGVPLIMPNFSATSQTLVVQMVMPFTEGNTLGLYRLAINPARDSQTITSEMLTAYGKIPSGVYAPALSGDKSFAATPINDPNNPLARYVQDGPYMPASGIVISVLDRDDDTQPIAVPQGRGVEQLQWSETTFDLYFVAGTYQNSSIMSSPSLYRYNLIDDSVAELGTLESDSTLRVPMVAVCGEYAFWLAITPDNVTTLYSAPVNNLSQRTQYLQQQAFMNITCIYPF